MLNASFTSIPMYIRSKDSQYKFQTSEKVFLLIKNVATT